VAKENSAERFQVRRYTGYSAYFILASKTHLWLISHFSEVVD
jgi:hypothetical protein